MTLRLFGGLRVILYNGIESTASIVPAGVGQSTMMGPLIFIYYMNDIVDNVTVVC